MLISYCWKCSIFLVLCAHSLQTHSQAVSLSTFFPVTCSFCLSLFFFLFLFLLFFSIHGLFSLSSSLATLTLGTSYNAQANQSCFFWFFSLVSLEVPLSSYFFWFINFLIRSFVFTSIFSRHLFLHSGKRPAGFIFKEQKQKYGQKRYGQSALQLLCCDGAMLTWILQTFFMGLNHLCQANTLCYWFAFSCLKFTVSSN